jgi:class 3 adenylate cyclase/tetratricopeptide (TPR) repeat protein
MAACAQCGEQNPARARFCLACGASLTEAPKPETRARKTVTVLFSDIKDSTPLGEQLDPEATRQVMNRYFGEVRAVIERHGGTVEKFIGDAVMAVFGTPRVHEDDPLRAVRAATEMRTVLADLSRELQDRWGIRVSIRTGVNTGEVVAGDPATRQTFVTGDAVNVASRLEHAAGPGEILIGDQTYRLVRDAVLVEPCDPLDVKGKSEPITAWRVLGVVSGAPAVARRLDSPLVGRERELAMLHHAFDRAADDQTCQFVTILGPAGAGKSRVTAELLGEVGERATVLVGRCLPYGEGITFWPVVEIVKQAAGLGASLAASESRRRLASIVSDDPERDAIVDRLGSLFGYGSGGTEEIFWAVRRLLQALAHDRPVVVVFEDVHWGEQTFLDLIDHITDWARDAPILVICLARAELLEERSAWAGGKVNSTSLLLEPLPDEACATLIENLLDRTVTTTVKERIARSAEGNPLFVEELVAMLVDDGSLRREAGRWVTTTDLSSLAVPPTIQALLDARLDRLPAEERRVLECAAVAGRIFSRSAVRVLTRPEEHPSVDDHLADLVRKQLIRPHHTRFGRENTYRFRHSLVRDAAYRQMPKAARADFHERFARWLETAGGPRSAEQEEILGYHLEQAFRFRQELGESRVELAERAGERLGSAGRRAVDRGDNPAAVSLLTRATSLLPDSNEERRELLPMLGSALMRTGDFPRAERVLTEALEAARSADDRRLELRTMIEREFYRAFTHPEESVEDIVAVADSAIPLLEELGDNIGLAKAWWLKSEAHLHAFRWAARTEHLERALEYARRAGDAGEQATIAAQLAQAVYYGPTPVPAAIERCEQLLRDVPTTQSLRASVTGALAGLRAMQGDLDEARRLHQEARSIWQEQGQRFRIAMRSLIAADIEFLADQPEEATAVLRWAYTELRAMGAQSVIPPVSAFLADALCEEGHLEEAEHFAKLARDGATPVDVVAQVMWRIALARATADTELAREAIELAERTDSPDLKARAYTAAGDFERARRAHEAKGNVAAARRLLAREAASS